MRYPCQVLVPLPAPSGDTRFVWSHMSEADRVFSRMITPGSLPSPEDKQFLQVTSRRRGAAAGQSRTVEVVHRRSSRTSPSAEPAPAASWLDGFQGRSSPAMLSTETPTASPGSAPQVGHLMPGWEPLLLPLQPAAPVEPIAKIPAGTRRQPRVAELQPSEKQPRSARRSFADPFAAEDTGANCIRCGYLVSPAREKRGLMTCAQCQ